VSGPNPFLLVGGAASTSGLNYDNGVISAGDLELTYREEGEGEHNVLLLHGLNAHSGTWRKTFPALTDRYRVFALSFPPNMEGSASDALVERYADCARLMCDRLGITTTAIIGNSIGGWTAMRLAAGGRVKVSRLILEDTAGSDSVDARWLEKSGTPTLIIWGENDDVTPIHEGRDLHSRLSGSRLEVISKANHVPHWEEPDVFNRLVTEFLVGS
jgi:pimeloyl-ACP methyl ester carboxylesterase